MYDEVLLPIEERAITHSRITKAIDVTIQNDARMHVLFIIDIPVETGKSKLRYLNEAEENGIRRINEIKEAMPDTLETTGEVEKGTLSKVLKDYQNKNGIDLTVLNRNYFNSMENERDHVSNDEEPDYLIVSP